MVDQVRRADCPGDYTARIPVSNRVRLMNDRKNKHDEVEARNRGVDAVNQEFRRFEQVHKQQSYQLAEKPDTDQFDDDFVIPRCDMGLYFHGGEQGRMQFAQDLGDALKGIGFAILTGHEIDPALYTSASRKVANFFELSTREDRMPYQAQRSGSVNQGYFPIRETTIIHPDQVEGWVFCRRAFNLDETAGFNESEFWPPAGL